MSKIYVCIIAIAIMLSSFNKEELTSRPLTGTKAYSPIFIDLVDDVNQKIIHGEGRPDDNVTGYTMTNLSRIALKAYGLTSLKTKLKKNKPSNVTDEDIGLLFEKYEEIW